MKVLFVCTANTGRSPLAEALFRAHARRLDGPVSAGSAGIRATAGEPVSGLVARAARSYGADLTAHRSRQLTAELLTAADLVVAMATEHRDGVAHLAPARAARTFLLRELVVRIEQLGARGPGEAPTAYVGRLAEVEPSFRPDPDIADPYGRPVEVLWSTVFELDDLVGKLAGRLFPPTPSSSPRPGTLE